MSLAVLILAYNEKKHIEDVVKNAKKCTDEVIVIDSGSTDGTVEIAEGVGAKVVHRKLENDFATQRNFAAKQTNADWILYLDADERMDDELIRNIKKVVKIEDGLEKRKQYFFVRRIFAFGHSLKYGAFRPDKVTRLFPKDEVVWKNKVHERPECALKLEGVNGWVDHYTYDKWQQWLDKMGKYTSIWAEDNYEKGAKSSIGKALSHAILGFIKVYILQKGFLDGTMGLVGSYQHAFYTLFKYLKLNELQRTKK